jgi:hypothetical protein
MHWEKACRSGSPAAGSEPAVAESAGSLVGGAPVVVGPLVAVTDEVGSDAADRLAGDSVPQAAATNVTAAVAAATVATNREFLTWISSA